MKKITDNYQVPENIGDDGRPDISAVINSSAEIINERI